MAKVPEYGTDSIDLAAAPAVRQTTQTTAADFFNDGGAGVAGQGLMALGAAGLKYAAQEQEKTDEARVREKFVALSKGANESIYGSNGVSTRVGADAVGAADKWTGDFNKIKGELEADLTPQQKVIFERVSQQVYLSNFDNVLKHESRQKLVYEDSQRNNTIDTTKKTAGLNWGDERMIAAQINTGLGALRGKPEYKGADPDIRATMEKSLEAEYHATVILSAMNADNPMAAKAYLEKNGQLLRAANPDGYDKLSDSVRKGAVEKGAEALSTVSMTKGLSGGMSMLDAELDKAKALPEGQERTDKIGTIELAKKEHKRRFSESEQVKTAEERKASEEAYQFMREKGGKVLPPLAIRNRMDAKAAFALEQDFRNGGAKVETDWAAYAVLRKNARENPEEFAKRDLFKYFGVLGKAERETLLDLQQKFATEKPEKVQHIQSFEAFVTGYAADNKLYQSGDTKENYWKFENTVKEKVGSIAKSKGVTPDKLTDDDWKTAADWAVMKEKPRFMLPDRARYEVRGTDDAAKFAPAQAVTVEDIPVAEKNRIRDRYLATQGSMPPGKKIVEIYNNEKKK